MRSGEKSQCLNIIRKGIVTVRMAEGEPLTNLTTLGDFPGKAKPERAGLGQKAPPQAQDGADVAELKRVQAADQVLQERRHGD